MKKNDEVRMLIRLGAHMSISMGSMSSRDNCNQRKHFSDLSHSPRMWKASLPKSEMSASFISEMKDKSQIPFRLYGSFQVIS